MNPADANFPLRIFSEDVVRGVLSSIWGIKVTGLENIPLEGPVILSPNHASLVDPPLVAVAVSSRRRPFGIGKKELFEKPLLGWWLRGTGSFPIDRQGDATSAMRAALEVLSKGGCLVIYPEGTRVRPGEKRAPKSGVAFLAARTGAAVVPVRVLGTAEFPRKFPLEVRIGEPLPPPGSQDRATGLAYAKSLMERIYSL
ncbi:MAG: 1-acyl-sn-glycerol-3-phosphate acyltransferase [Elusimicrobia bacterium CG11_big_fil_rev_8_21_14_0_20_64_6]|nr:MAG: 1-acyl-sn-glycerol-3-phosphate acyltransferase [Elusimicrobia bacterium CG11_big_fil_rev_8_21_14_0_20_64_6]